MDRKVERVTLQQEQDCSMEAANSEYLQNTEHGY